MMSLWRVPLDAEEVQPLLGEVQVRQNWCKGCRFCVEFCPRDVLTLSHGFNPKGYHYPEVEHADECVDCKLCERLCPEFAIVVVSRPSSAVEPTPAPSVVRRVGP